MDTKFLTNYIQENRKCQISYHACFVKYWSGYNARGERAKKKLKRKA